jgi:hypothetical protein
MIAFAFAAGLAVSAPADDPFGTWRRPSTPQVNFYNCGGKLLP